MNSRQTPGVTGGRGKGDLIVSYKEFRARHIVTYLAAAAATVSSSASRTKL